MLFYVLRLAEDVQNVDGGHCPDVANHWLAQYVSDLGVIGGNGYDLDASIVKVLSHAECRLIGLRGDWDGSTTPESAKHSVRQITMEQRFDVGCLFHYLRYDSRGADGTLAIVNSRKRSVKNATWRQATISAPVFLS